MDKFSMLLNRKDDIAIKQFYQQCYKNVEKINPQDSESLHQLNDIMKTSKTFDEFKDQIVSNLNPIYLVGINTQQMLENSNIKQDISPLKFLPNQQNLTKTGFMPNKMLLKEQYGQLKSQEKKNQDILLKFQQQDDDDKYLKYPVFDYLQQQMMQNNIVIHQDYVKQRLDHKIHEYRLKSFDPVCLEFINDSLLYQTRTIVEKLIKISYIDNDLEEILMKKDDQIDPQRLIPFQTEFNRKSLLEKIVDPHNQDYKIYIGSTCKLVKGKSKQPYHQMIKIMEKSEKLEQERLEEQLSNKQMFEEMDGKPQKKVKKTTDDQLDIYNILLKNKTQKVKDLDNIKKTTEDTQKAIEFFTSNQQVQKQLPQTDQTNYNIGRQSEKSFPLKSKIQHKKITIKSLLFLLENDPVYKKSPFLLKSYLKSNAF